MTLFAVTSAEFAQTQFGVFIDTLSALCGFAAVERHVVRSAADFDTMHRALLKETRRPGAHLCVVFYAHGSREGIALGGSTLHWSYVHYLLSTNTCASLAVVADTCHAGYLAYHPYPALLAARKAAAKRPKSPVLDVSTQITTWNGCACYTDYARSEDIPEGQRLAADRRLVDNYALLVACGADEVTYTVEGHSALQFYLLSCIRASRPFRECLAALRNAMFPHTTPHLLVGGAFAPAWDRTAAHHGLN